MDGEVVRSAQDGFVGFDARRFGQEGFELGEHREGVGLVKVDIEGLFGGVSGEEEEDVRGVIGAVETVVEDAGLGAGNGDAVAKFAFELGGLAGFGPETDGDDKLLGFGHRAPEKGRSERVEPPREGAEAGDIGPVWIA